MPYIERGDAHYTVDEHRNHIKLMEDTATKYPTGSQWHIQGHWFTVLDVVSTGPSAPIWLVARWQATRTSGLVISTHELLENT